MQPALQTVPNSAIPAGFRRRARGADEKATAAGIVFVTPQREALFLKRGPKGDHAGEWCFPGGGVEGDEEPHEAARREAIEETGMLPRWELAPLDRRTSAEGVDFVTFGQPVAGRFEPKINDEHVGHVWAPLSRPPEPLHPGIKALLAGDDVDGVKSIKIKFFDDGEIATDSALALALDRESVREIDKDGRLKVAVTNISKATVNPYVGREIPDWEKLGLDPNKVYRLFRDPEELRKAAKTFNGVQLLKKHVPVSAEDHQPWDVVGTTGTDAEFVDPYLRNSLYVWAKGAIDEIESDAKKELSCGYHYKADMTPGEFEGKRFDGVMREIVGNHVALVKDGRAGPDVVVGDDMIEVQWAILERELSEFIVNV